MLLPAQLSPELHFPHAYSICVQLEPGLPLSLHSALKIFFFFFFCVLSHSGSPAVSTPLRIGTASPNATHCSQSHTEHSCAMGVSRLVPAGCRGANTNVTCRASDHCSTSLQLCRAPGPSRGTSCVQQSLEQLPPRSHQVLQQSCCQPCTSPAPEAPGCSSPVLPCTARSVPLLPNECR